MPSGYVGIAEMMPQGRFEISKHLPRQGKNLAVSHTSRLITIGWLGNFFWRGDVYAEIEIVHVWLMENKRGGKKESRRNGIF